MSYVYSVKCLLGIFCGPAISVPMPNAYWLSLDIININWRKLKPAQHGSTTGCGDGV